MEVSHHTSLQAYNTFGIDVKARQFISVKTLEELRLVLKQNYARDLFILGGGSNMLLTKDVEATVLHIDLLGKSIVKQQENDIFVKICAGENWHQTVLWTLENNWGGLENLSLIPGNTGTSPIQNIGAYGVELKDVFISCEAINIQTLEIKEFTKEECEFDYRSSIFKTRVKNKYIITSVVFKLTRNHHVLHTGYGAINDALQEMGVSKPTIQDIAAAVIKIRSQKLPDPRKLGNSGSFFKNPVIEESKLERLLKIFPEMPHYKVADAQFKVPAGWLIEKAGLKGYREGDAGVHQNQALVLVNYGTASGEDILILSQKIQNTILQKFDIELEAEVNIF